MRKTVLALMAGGSVLALTSAFAFAPTPFTPGGQSQTVIPERGSMTYTQVGCDAIWDFTYDVNATTNKVVGMTATAHTAGALQAECGLGGGFVLNETTASGQTYTAGTDATTEPVAAATAATWVFTFSGDGVVAPLNTGLTGVMTIAGA